MLIMAFLHRNLPSSSSSKLAYDKKGEKRDMRKLFMNVFAHSGTTFANSERRDPYKNFNFSVTIVGKKVFAKAGFRTISGLNFSSEVVEYRDGDDTQLSTSKSAGLLSTEPVTFERGMSEDMDIADWMSKVAGSNDEGVKTTITIELKDRARNGVKKWELRNCWISGYETGDFDAQGNEVMIERMIVQHEGMKVLKGDAPGGAHGTFDIG